MALHDEAIDGPPFHTVGEPAELADLAGALFYEVGGGPPPPLELAAAGLFTFQGTGDLTVGVGDTPPLRFTWPVLQAADVPLRFTWTVLAPGVADPGLRFRWRVFADHPALGFTWPVLPGAILDLFDSKGEGAAAGIPADILLPVGRAVKE